MYFFISSPNFTFMCGNAEAVKPKWSLIHLETKCQPDEIGFLTAVNNNTVRNESERK